MLASFPKETDIRPARNFLYSTPAPRQTRRKRADWKTQSRAPCANAFYLGAFD
jgi:hypothetical protein